MNAQGPPTGHVHVIHVSHVFGSRHGGSEYSKAIVEALRSCGVTVTLLAAKFEACDDDGDQGGIRCVVLQRYFAAGWRNWLPRLGDMVRLWRVALSSRPCVILVQGDLPRVTYIFLQFFVPLIFIRQDCALTCPANHRYLPRSRTVCRKPAGWSCLAVHSREHCFGGISLLHRVGRVLYRLRDGILLRGLHHFVVNSNYIRLCHRRDGDVLHPPNLSNIQASIDVPRDLKQIAFCGRLEEEKGAAEAIRTLAALPDGFHLHLIGDGSRKSDLAGLVRSLGLEKRVHFHGWLPPGNRDVLLAGSGVLLMPSLCGEGFGMAGIEAFAQGTPVVACDAGGIPEWCLPDAGRLVPCGDVSAAASAVLEITKSPGRWQHFSQAARQTAASQFARSRFKEELLSIIGSRTGVTFC